VALTADEVAQIKYELEDHVLDVSAEPYLGYTSLYEVVRRNVAGSDTPATTSSTAVTAEGPVTLTLGSVTGIAAVTTKLVLDVDDAREVVTVRGVTGATVSVICKKLHSGTYPVEIASGLTIVRGILADLAAFDSEISGQRLVGGIKKVDEVEFFGKSEGLSRQEALRQTQYLRRLDLARAIGLGWRLAQNAGASGNLTVY
jgi:hypothetical protein